MSVDLEGLDVESWKFVDNKTKGQTSKRLKEKKASQIFGKHVLTPDTHK